MTVPDGTKMRFFFLDRNSKWKEYFERDQCLRFIEDSNARRLGLTNEITSNLGSENDRVRC